MVKQVAPVHILRPLIIGFRQAVVNDFFFEGGDFVCSLLKIRQIDVSGPAHQGIRTRFWGVAVA
jgi:hypothetical protein